MVLPIFVAMIWLERMVLYNFRSYAEGEFQFGRGVNAFTGPNGSGKTNLLDAIHYLCLSKSYLHSSDQSNVRHGADFFSLNGRFQLDHQEEDILCLYRKDGGKSFKRNQKEYTRIGDHIGLLPVVMIAPSDQELISGGSEDRRRLMDSVLSQLDPSYLESLMAYNRTLLQRNSALKNRIEDYALIEVFDHQLDAHAQLIHQKRYAFIESLKPAFVRIYSGLSEAGEAVELDYKSQLHEESMTTLLGRYWSRDRVMQFTGAGVHRDDLEFRMNQYAVKRTGSQGQQKSFLLALKLALFEQMQRSKGMAPILLLDDVFDKLDETRVGGLMKVVSGEGFGQIFLSDTHDDRIQSVFNKLGIPLLSYRF